MNPIAMIPLVVTGLVWLAPPAPLAGPVAPVQAQDAVPPALAPEAVVPTLTMALFGRLEVADDAAWELDPGPAVVDGKAIVGWTSLGEAFEFVPFEGETFGRGEYLGRDELSARLAPEIVQLVEDSSTRFRYAYGLLLSPLGTVVAYTATVTLTPPGATTRRFVRPLAAFDPADSASFLPALATLGLLDDTGSRFLVVPTGGMPVPRGFRGFLRTAGCVLLTAACIGVTAISAIGCAAACATVTPACVACIVGAVTVIKAVCCSACICWRNLGSVASCPC